MEDPRPANSADSDLERDAEDPQEDFASLFEASQTQRDKRIERDQKVDGTIVSIGEEWVFVDIGSKSEGHISREELLDREGQLRFQVGDPLAAYVVKTGEGDILLSVKMTSAASEEAIRGAFRSGLPVEGLVTGERKGGYTVKVLGKEGFCPYSLIDLHGRGASEDYLNHRFTFRIVEYSEGGRNIVISRRNILEEERLKEVARLKETLHPGDVVEGMVRNIADFGVFVDIGGIEGLIPMSELAWYRVNDASEIVRTGDRLTVKVMDLNWETKRISLSLKQTLEDPWNSAAEAYGEGKTFEGTVTKLMNFGAFVELQPGIEGLIHVSKLGGGRRINHPREVVNVGDSVEVVILSVDQGTRRIGLELNIVEPEDEDTPLTEFNIGDTVTGIVDSVQDYGVFVTLPGGKSGLLHVSEIDAGRRGDLKKRFVPGAAIEVEIRDINEDTKKISLSARSILKRREEAEYKDFVTGKGGGRALGTLGDLLSEKLKK